MSSDPAHVIPVEAHPGPAIALAEVPSVEAPTTAPTVAPHARRMLDRYEIIAEIAKGGMGTVYLARLEGAGGFERLMALKLMHEHLAEEEQFVTMLLDEARTAASIHHPNAVGIVDVCESPVGYYLVMNYVDGFSLWQVMTHPALDDVTRIRVSTRLIADALHGLHGAHTAKNAKGERLGIVHRDVSPQNVLVGTDGMGRIVDFGIALAASRVASSRPGVLKGKPSYMAPEQARGDACDARTDVFAMGIVLWEALVNERLFWAEMDVAILMQVMDCNVERPDARRAHVPAPLADVVMKALARAPADRYASARDFAVAIERAAEAAGLLATTHEVEEQLSKLFVDEIADKQRAIAGHLSASSGSPVTLQKGQLGTIPRLITRKPAARELGTRASGVRSRGTGPEVALAPTSAATPMAVSVASRPESASSSPSVVIADDLATGSANHSGADAKSAHTRRIGMMLGAVGVVLAVAAALVWLVGSNGETPVAAPARPETSASGDPARAASQLPGTSSPAPVPAPAPELAAPEAAPAPVAIEAAPVVPAPGREPEVPAPSVGSRSAGSSTVGSATVGTSRGHRHTTMQTSTAAGSTASDEPSPPSTSTGPALESNPYLSH